MGNFFFKIETGDARGRVETMFEFRLVLTNETVPNWATWFIKVGNKAFRFTIYLTFFPGFEFWAGKDGGVERSTR